MSEFLTTLGIIVALFLSIYNFYNSILSHRRKRQKLINTVYYHVIHARESLQGQKKGNKSIRERIRNNNSYTPYAARSPADDLTYDHIIEVMEWLDEDGEKAVSSYFHAQMGLHALGQSFDLDFVRDWPQERKLQLWDAYVLYQANTLKYAEKAEDILQEILKSPASK